MTRWALPLGLAGAIVFVVLSVTLRVGLWGSPEAYDVAGPPASRGSLAVGVRVDRRPPPIPLRDARGHRTSLAALRGRWVVLAPSMTLCHQVCPITTGALMDLRRRMRASGAGRKLAIVELTTDPWRDSPRRLRAYRRRTGARLTMLTGSLADVRRLWRFFGVRFARTPIGHPAPIDWMTGRPERFDVEHTDGLFLLGPGGRERVAIAGMPGTGGRLRSSLRSLLNAEGRQNLRRPQAPWTPARVAVDLRSLMRLRPAAEGAQPPTLASARRRLAGSPPPLAALHRQAGRLLAGAGLQARLRALRGHPVALDVWASWCPPCRQQIPLFATAAAAFGRRVAFLGADLSDERASARAALAGQGLSYPSYEVSTAQLAAAVGTVPGTPVTFFLGPGGHLRGEHVGAYPSLAALDADLRRYGG